MKRFVIAALVVAVSACGGSPTASATSPTPIQVAIPSPITLPSAAANPTYPPVDLADIVALGDEGVARTFIGAEGQNLGTCSRGWERIYEPAATSARQRAADMVKFALVKNLFTKSCGGMVFGTENAAYCNCYHGENGYLEIDRGPSQAPAPGKMEVIFQAVQDHPSAADWDITLDAPSG